MAECAKTSCEIFALNRSVAHIVLDPINDGTKPSCNLHWYDRIQDGDLQPFFSVLLAALILTCLRMLFGFINLRRNHKPILLLTKVLFVGEKLVLVVSLVLLARLTAQLQFLCIALILLIMDTVIHFTPAKIRIASNSWRSDL